MTSSDLPEGQQSKELAEIIRIAAAAIPYDLISTPAVGIGDARRLRLAEAIVPAVVARVRAAVAEEIAEAIERDDEATYAWEAARIAREHAAAPAERSVGSPTPEVGTPDHPEG